METQELKSIVEALVFAADEPLSEARLRETLEPENGFDFDAVIAALNQEYQSSGRAFMIRKIAGGYQIVTQQNYASWIRKLYLGRQKNRLSHAALETLALIAFKQPISRVDIAQIRGVNSDGVIGTLLERKLVTISGRSEAVGRPLLYSTTAEFLKYFGINDIADLPKPREIEELFSKEGMPEELLQALSQTDAQLSLPINGEAETPATPDEIENKIAPALPPVIVETPVVMEAPVETAEIESPEIIADSPAEIAEIESSEIVVDSPAEVSEIELPEIVADSSAENVADDVDTTKVAARPLLMPEISAVDINEEVVTQLEAADKLEAVFPPSAPTPAGENEIAWISSTDDSGNAAEQFTGNELALDDLTETAKDLPTFAAVAEVVSVPSPEKPAAAIEDFTETANDLPTFAGVSEVIAETLTSEATGADEEMAAKLSSLEAITGEMAADFVRTDAVTGDRDDPVSSSFVAGVAEVVAMVTETPAMEVQVVETCDVGRADIESPPESQSTAEEVDGWMAEDFSPEEIVEPDFIKKSVDFFLEEERHDLAAAIGAVAAESEAIVVSDAALSSVADEIFLHPAETENNFTAPVEPSSATLPPLIQSGFPVETGNVETAPEQVTNVTVVDFAESPIIKLRQEIPVLENEAIAMPVIEGEAVAAEKLEAETIALSPANVKFATESHLPSETIVTEAMAATTPEAPLFENDDSGSTTLRERVVGWIKRTLDKLMTFIGVTPKSE